VHYHRAVRELTKLFSNRVRRHRRHFGKVATETLEPRALLAFSAGNVLVFRVATAEGVNKANRVALVQYPPTAGASAVDTTIVPGGTGGLTDEPDENTGFLNISSDGQYIVLMGTEAAAGAPNLNGVARSVYRYGVDGTGRQIASLAAGAGSGFTGPKAPNGATTFGGDPNSASTY
jgi:hypothetical protein